MLNTYVNSCPDYGTVIGLQVSDCDLKSLGMFFGNSMIKKGIKFDVNLTPLAFKTAWDNHIRAGEIIPLGQAFGFTPNNPENRTATGSLDLKSDLGYGIPEFTVEYDRSHCFDNQIAKVLGKTWDYVFHFEKATLMTTTSDGMFLKGFDTSYNSKSFVTQTNSSAQTTKVMYQLSYSGAVEYNERKVGLDVAKIGFDPLETNGVVQLDINVTTVLTNADTYFNVTVLNACNGTPITGLGDVDFWGLQNSEGNTIDGVADEGNGVYKINVSNPAVTGEVYRAYLSDGTYNTYNSIVTNLGVIYSGTTKQETVAQQPT